MPLPLPAISQWPASLIIASGTFYSTHPVVMRPSHLTGICPRMRSNCQTCDLGHDASWCGVNASGLYLWHNDFRRSRSSLSNMLTTREKPPPCSQASSSSAVPLGNRTQEPAHFLRFSDAEPVLCKGTKTHPRPGPNLRRSGPNAVHPP